MKIRVRTTQNIDIEYEVAGLGSRILAAILDSLIMLIFWFFAIFIAVGISETMGGVIFFVVVALMLFYPLLFEVFMNGQTPGKVAMNIRVVMLDGTTPSVGSYLLRWLLGLVDRNIIGVIVIAMSGKGQRLGDMAAGTTVIRTDQINSSDKTFIPLDDDYVPTFPQARQLSDKDIELIQRALEVNRETGNQEPARTAAERVKTLLGINSDLPTITFLYMIVKDFQHTTSKSG